MHKPILLKNKKTLADVILPKSANQPSGPVALSTDNTTAIQQLVQLLVNQLIPSPPPYNYFDAAMAVLEVGASTGTLLAPGEIEILEWVDNQAVLVLDKCDFMIYPAAQAPPNPVNPLNLNEIYFGLTRANANEARVLVPFQDYSPGIKATLPQKYLLTQGSPYWINLISHPVKVFFGDRIGAAAINGTSQAIQILFRVAGHYEKAHWGQ